MLPFDSINPQRKKFTTGVKNKVTGDLNLNDSPEESINLFVSHHSIYSDYFILAG